jgi:hypothetical protein
MRKKVEQQVPGALKFVRSNRRKFAAGPDVREPEGFTPGAIHKPAELEVVGEQQVRERREIALELAGPLRFVEVGPRVFGFDVAQRQVIAFAGDDIIRSPTVGAFGLVGRDNVRVERFEEFLQRRAVGVLGGVAAFEGAFELGEVILKRGRVRATATVSGGFFVN